MISVLVDTNQDGYADSAGYDMTGDGIVDSLDTTGDGRIDTVIVITKAASPPPTPSTGDSSKPATADGHQDLARSEELARQVYQVIDTDGDGNISKLELVSAMQRSEPVNDFVLPGIDCSNALKDEHAFEAIDTVFDDISGGSRRISCDAWLAYFSKAKKSPPDAEEAKLRDVFSLIDLTGSGSISSFELLSALHSYSSAASLLLPGVDRLSILKDQKSFDAACALFDDMSGGRKRVRLSDFLAYMRKPKTDDAQKQKTLKQPLKDRLRQLASKWRRADDEEDNLTHRAPDAGKLKPHHDKPRSEKYILIIGAGFGREINPRQTSMVRLAGFQIQWVEVPNPEQDRFAIMHYLGLVTDAIDRFRPDCIVSASKGDPYVIALWQRGLWKGPTVMINAHPDLRQLPKDTSIVLAHGSNDELYKWSRADLEFLISTGSTNRCFLYYTGDSGWFSGGFTRRGDMHNMESLLSYDCLPRLIDAAMCCEGPEMHMIWSWRDRMQSQRLEAEEWLSYCPELLRDRWTSTNHRGMDDQKLYQVLKSSEEFAKIETIFRSAPVEPASYRCATQDFQWERTAILRIERVENGLLEIGSTKPYYKSLRRSIEDQGLEFQPGVHTRWAFHGTNAIDSIIMDPMTGFQPLASGTRLGSLWGSGTYFARDARYVVEGNFCPPAADGSKQMLLCLLMTGMPCLGDPQHHGVLPFRQKPHRYNSAVDSLSSPEIFVTMHPGAAYPAYLITYI